MPDLRFSRSKADWRRRRMMSHAARRERRRRLAAPTPTPMPIAEVVGSMVIGAMVGEEGGAEVEVGELGVVAVIGEWVFEIGMAADVLVGMASEVGLGELVAVFDGRKVVGRVSVETDEVDVVEDGTEDIVLVLFEGVEVGVATDITVKGLIVLDDEVEMGVDFEDVLLELEEVDSPNVMLVVATTFVVDLVTVVLSTVTVAPKLVVVNAFTGARNLQIVSVDAQEAFEDFVDGARAMMGWPSIVSTECASTSMSLISTKLFGSNMKLGATCQCCSSRLSGSSTVGIMAATSRER
jgi:hypothetical protein